MKHSIEVARDGELPAGLIARNAEIRFAHQGESFVSTAELSDCRIVARKLRRVDWRLARLDRCTFAGTFSENDFGCKVLELPDGGIVSGSLRACDFRDARLDDCRFFSCDITDCQFPRWPGFVVMHPRQNAKRLVSLSWPGTLGMWAAVLSTASEAVVAVASDAAEMAKREKLKMEAIKRLLTRLGDVVVIT